MKTIIWKELRENFKWALLGFVCLALAELYALFAQGYNLPLCGSTFLLVTSFGCAIVGSALGAIQILPELRRDQWAALLHRPVPWSVIFFGKAAAGLLLYAFAAALPFLASVAIVATPGHFPAPFLSGMLLPGLADLALGVVFYFGGMLLSLHRGRWYGSRAVLCTGLLVVFLIHNGGWPFRVALGASLVVMLAAWGALLSRGRPQNRPWPCRIALLALLVVGAEGLLLIVDALLAIHAAPASRPSQSFKVTKDGRVFIETSGGNVKKALTDPNGKPITEERYLGNNSYSNYLQLIDFRQYLREQPPAEPNLLTEFFNDDLRSARKYVIPVGGSRTEIWYLFIRQNYFVGYDQLSHRCVGICDSQGFKPAGAIPKPFPERLRYLFYNPGRCFWCGPLLYAFDFPKRSVIPILDAKKDTIHAVAESEENRDQQRYVVVALENEFRVLDPKGAPVAAIPYGHDPAVWGNVYIAVNGAADRFFVKYSETHVKTRAVLLDESDRQGQLVHSYRFTRDADVPNPAFDRLEQYCTYTLPFAPTGLVASYWRSLPSSQEQLKTEATLPLPCQKMKGLAVLFGLGLFLGSLTWCWARSVEMSVGRASGWALFVVAFGLPGLLAFRLAAEWPTRVRCPKCARKRPVELEECPACQQAWPPPERNGSEIFDL
jgi:hypothetical protein